jgi:Flp pilus assembly protein TadD/TolB-like protein
MVLPFEQEGHHDDLPQLGRMLTRQVIIALTRFTDIFVYGHETAEGRADQTAAFPRVAVDYELSGTAAVFPGALDVELLLRKAGDGRFVWAQSIRRQCDSGAPKEEAPSRFLALCADIAGEVAGVIARRDGILDSQARDASGAAARSFAGYRKLLEFQDYWRSLDPDLFEPLRRDLELVVSENPTFAAAIASLSMLYSNAARYGYDVSAVTAEPLAHALVLANRAITLAPNSSRAHHARAIAEWFSGLTDASIATMLTAISLNPNDPELMGELGFRYAMRMDWGQAVPLIEQSYARNPLQSGQYRMGLFLYHFWAGDFQQALRETRAIGAPGVAVVHLAAAAALGEMGRKSEARDELREAERLSPDIRHDLDRNLQSRQIHPDLIAAILKAIGKIDSGWRPPLREVRLHRG